MYSQLTQGNFYGRTLKNFSTAGFNLSETHYEPGVRLPRHSHELPYFGFVLSGAYTEHTGRTVRACRERTLLYHPPGELHSQHFDHEAVRLFRIELNRARARAVSQADLRTAHSTSPHHDLIDALAHRLYREFCDPDSVSHLAVEGLALELIAATARRALDVDAFTTRPPRWLVQAHDLIKSRFAECLTLTDIACAVGVHAVTLAREFRRCYGCTVGEMVRRERVEFARRELARPGASLASVAVSSGFYDQSHFSRTFKRVTGITPARYRDSHSRG
jgi:AraC family transcriptional regulator